MKTIWHPVPTSDYSSIIASIPLDQGYDAVLYNGAGSDAVAFVKQYVEFGMQKKIPLLGQSNTFEKPDLDSMPTGDRRRLFGASYRRRHGHAQLEQFPRRIPEALGP